MQPAIRCSGLTKTYDGKVEAVRGLDLAIETGELAQVLGPLVPLLAALGLMRQDELRQRPHAIGEQAT